VLRLVLELDGDVVARVHPHIGLLDIVFGRVNR
jgi:NADH:ubiquinone oxidoreductase subunit D